MRSFEPPSVRRSARNTAAPTKELHVQAFIGVSASLLPTLVNATARRGAHSTGNVASLFDVPSNIRRVKVRRRGGTGRPRTIEQLNASRRNTLRVSMLWDQTLTTPASRYPAKRRKPQWYNGLADM